MQLTQMVTGTLAQGAITNIVYEVRYEQESYNLRTLSKTDNVIECHQGQGFYI